MILEVIYGKSIDHPDHPYLKYADTAAEAGIEAFLPGNLLVEFLPFLQYMPSWFPGAGFKRRLPKWYADSRGLHNFTFEDSKAEFVSHVVTFVFHTDVFHSRLAELLSLLWSPVC